MTGDPHPAVRAVHHAARSVLLSPADIAAIGTEVDQVVQRAEQEIERNDTSSGKPLDAFAPAIYMIRNRYEQIYRRGAAIGT